MTARANLILTLIVAVVLLCSCSVAGEDTSLNAPVAELVPGNTSLATVSHSPGSDLTVAENIEGTYVLRFEGHVRQVGRRPAYGDPSQFSCID